MSSPPVTPVPGMSPFAALVRFFVHHRTAANLLLAVLVLVGMLSLQRLNTQFFPTIDIPRISVSVTWAGATPADMEKTVIRNLEPALRFIDGLDDFTGVAREGSAYISLTFKQGTDMDRALSDVEKAVDGVTTLPEDADPPVIRQVVRYELVGRLLVSGPYSERTLKAWARKLRDGLLDAGLERVTFSGARTEEIVIETSQYQLVRLNMDAGQLAARVRAETVDTPAGDISGGLDKTVHGAGRERNAEAIGRIVVRAGPDGENIRLADVAAISEGFDPDQERGYASGQPAIRINIWRTPSADTLKTAATFKEYVARIKPTLPADLKVLMFDVRANYLKDRIGLLINNGAQGLALVLIILFIFLNGRIAFWVAAGIPVSMMATVAVMYFSGQSVNMVSLFALILTLGIIVDDAIVVGEHTETLRTSGLPADVAAEQGALRMLAPVTAATLTTMASFMPLFFFQGRVGAIIIALPLVVISVLMASLTECFLILPAHLKHAMRRNRQGGRLRQAFDRAFARLRDGPFARLVALAHDWRYVMWALMMAALVMAISLPLTGRMRFNFFPSPESEHVSAYLVMAAGTPEKQTLAAMGKVEEALREVERKLGKGEKLIVATFTRVGKMGYSNGDHLAQLDVQLTNSEARSVRTSRILRAWREAMPEIAGLERVSFGRRHMAGSPKDIEIELKGDDPFVLKQAAGEVAGILRRIKGTSAVEDNLPWGKLDVRIRITPRGEALGFDLDGVTRQVRAALRGTTARRFARDLEEVALRVRRAGRISGMAQLQNIYVRSKSGNWLPLADVAELTERPGFSVIYRQDGKVALAVSADIDLKVTSIAEVEKALAASELAAIASRHGISVKVAGGAEEQRKTLGDLKVGGIVALILIYIILAWVFGSYGLPLVVMTIIPFGVIGAIVGHWLMGYSLTILSLIGLLGLSGIIINDSIILVARARERAEGGESPREAAIGAARDRLRAVLLTSLTTIGGLTPLLFEKSLQAQFLQPMAITIVFGLAGATILVLLLVPATLGIGHDLRRVFAPLIRFIFPAADRGRQAAPPRRAGAE